MRSFLLLVASVFVFTVAPFSAHAQKTGSCNVFPADNPWNQDISKLPVHPQSDTWIAKIGVSGRLHPDWGSPRIYGIPYTLVSGSQPLVPIIFDPTNGYPDQSDVGPWPIPPTAMVEGDSTDPNYEDHHVLVVDTDHCMLYELYHAVKDPSGPGWIVWSSAKFDLNSDGFRPDGWTSCDAAGLPIFPGLVRYDEVTAGEIKHAVRFTISKTQQGWITPARHEAGGSDVSYPPMGMRMRLKDTVSEAGFTGGALVIVKALKKYGMILADNGSNWYITGATDSRWDDNNIGQLKKITGSEFESVYTGPTKTTEVSGSQVLLYRDSLSFMLTPNAVYTDSLTIINAGNSTLTISKITSTDSTVRCTGPSSIAAGATSTLRLNADSRRTTTGFAKKMINVLIASNNNVHPTDTVFVAVDFTDNAVREIVPVSSTLSVFPNPVAASANIQFDLSEASTVSIALYNAMGERIATLLNARQDAGSHTLPVSCDGLPDGIYFYRLTAGASSSSGKLVVAR